MCGFLSAQDSGAALQIAWEPPSVSLPQVLKTYTLEELGKKKEGTLNEVDPLAGDATQPVRFTGPSLAALVEETMKGLSAADRATTDLVVLRARNGKEVLMPKAFLVKYPQIQLALKKNGQALGEAGPRIVLPATTNSKIKSENILLEPLFVSELAQVTLTSYDRRFGSFLLKRRTDPAAMRGEKLFLQNCVSCHTQPQGALNALATADKVERLAGGEHPEARGVREFRSLFDKKATRSLSSYLEAFRFQIR